MSDEFESEKCAWVKLFHSSGALVTLPVPMGQVDDYYKYAFDAVGAAVAAGFLVTCPGLEAGEQKEQVGYVLRRSKSNQDKSETPIIDLYSPNEAMGWKMFSCYLNNDQQIEEFEQASGIKLNSIREFPGAAAPERGANRQSDSFIVRAPKPFTVILKANPKYNPDEPDATKRKPKRLFVRWNGQAVATAGNGTTAPDQPHQPTLSDWRKRLAGQPNESVLTGWMKDLNQYMNDKVTWLAVLALVNEYAANEGYEWDARRKLWLAPVEQSQQDDDGVIPF